MTEARWAIAPSRMTRKKVRRILVEDAMEGMATPIDWATAAYVHLGRGNPAKIDDELRSVIEEVRSKGGYVPGAPL